MKGKKLIRSIGWVMGTLLLGLMLALVLIPYVYKDELIEGFRKAINERITAEVQWKDVDVSMFRSFPNMELQIIKPKIIGQGGYERDTLFQANNVDLAFDIFSVINKEREIELNELNFDTPILKLLVNEKNQNNYQIVKEDTSELSQTNIFGHLREYNITDGAVNYENKANNIVINIDGLAHKGTGDFSLDNFILKTQSNANSVSIAQNDIHYLKNAKAQVLSNIEVNVASSIFSFEESQIQLNELMLSGNGNIDYHDESSIFMDMNFKTDNNDFSKFYSVIPGTYSKDFNDIKTSGVADLTAQVLGNYQSEKNVYPKFEIKSRISNGSVQLVNKKGSVENIKGHLTVKNTFPDLASTTIEFTDAGLEIENQRLGGTLLLSDLMGNTKVKGKINGNLDFESLVSTLKLSDIESMEGNAIIDVNIDVNRKDILDKKYDQIQSTGSVSLNNITVRSKSFPFLKINNGDISLSPKTGAFSVDEVSFGNSSFDAGIMLNDPLSILFGGNPEFTISVDASSIDANELSNLNHKTEDGVETDKSKFNYLDSLSADYTISIDQFLVKEKIITELISNGSYKDGNLSIQNFKGNDQNDQLTLAGELNNLSGYISSRSPVKGTLNIKGTKLNCDDWFVSSDASVKDSSRYVVPSNVNITMVSQLDEIIYDGISFKNFKGDIIVKDEKAELKGLSANVFGGKVLFDGYYDTSNKDRPKFAISYDIHNFRFKDSFEKITTFQLMAPLVKYIDGIFNSKFVISGELTKKRLPDLSTLTAVGFLETREGRLKKWEPAERLANKLNVAALNELPFQNSINFFELVDGILKFQDLKLEHNGMKLDISGGHSFNNQIGYYISAKIPKKLIGESPGGSQLIKGMDFLNQEASKLGFSLAEGDYVEMDISLTGTYASPEYTIKPKLSSSSTSDIKDKLGEKAEEKIENVKKKLEDTIQSTKDAITKKVEDTIKGKVDELKDTITKVVVGKKDDIINKGKEILTDKTKERLDSIFGKRKTDSLETTIGKTLEDIFKKKKKNSKKGMLDQVLKKGN